MSISIYQSKKGKIPETQSVPRQLKTIVDNRPLRILQRKIFEGIRSSLTIPVQLETDNNIHQLQLNDEEELLQGKFTEPVQKMDFDEEELLQGKFTEPVQKMDFDEEEELLQGKFSEPVQKMDFDEEELLQGKFSEPVQKMDFDEEELLQGKFSEPVQKMGLR